MTKSGYSIGIDVGTGSARAALFDLEGRRLAMAVRPIRMWKPHAEWAEQSSEDIWQACAACVREVMEASGAPPEAVAGIGFDATCSLVAVGAEGEAVGVSPGVEDARNVIVWMDHRATAEALEINETGHEVLQYVGGRVSPEMQTPKLLWLKRHHPEAWARAAHFFDLPDYLTFRATGEHTRSLCTTVCKWTYRGHEAAEGGEGWDAGFFEQIGLGDLAAERFARIGQRVRPMGEALGGGLTAAAARDFGLRPGTPVGVGIIDAHAGGLGALGAGAALNPDGLDARLALIGGTSSCHMAVSAAPRFIGGIWGPYFSAMIPGFWLTEGGQSATGALIDHVIFSHAQAPALQAEAEARGASVYALLNETLEEPAKDLPFPALLTRDLHVLDYFHGNRSPRADATLTGMATGLRLDASRAELARLYLATVQAVAYGTRHIIEEMNRAGYHIDTIIAAGGGVKNPVFLREHADITGCTLILPEERESVLLGSAMLGAVAGGRYADVLEAMARMSSPGEALAPADGRVRAYHDAKYAVYLRLYEDQMEYRRLMRGV